MKKVVFLIGIIFLVSCVKETDWKFPGDTPALIVVDGILTDVPGVQTVKLTFTVSELNQQPEPVSGAQVLLSTEDSSYVLGEDSLHKGSYLTNSGFSATVGKNYTLQIFYKDKIYSAKASMQPGILFDPLKYSAGDDGSYHIDFVASAFEPEDPAMWEIILDWSSLPGYNPADSLVNRARLLFYTLPTIDVTEIFAPEVEKVTFPAGTIVTQRRYSLTPEYAGFVRELLSETSWQGGLFCTLPADVSTNLSSGATGYFAVCGVRTISFTINP